jgi:hypothetical protein
MSNEFEKVDNVAWQSLTLIVQSQSQSDEYHKLTLKRSPAGVVGSSVRCTAEGDQLTDVSYLSEQWHYSQYSWYQSQY